MSCRLLPMRISEASLTWVVQRYCKNATMHNARADTTTIPRTKGLWENIGRSHPFLIRESSGISMFVPHHFLTIRLLRRPTES
jgi:hypothetical protein